MYNGIIYIHNGIIYMYNGIIEHMHVMCVLYTLCKFLLYAVTYAILEKQQRNLLSLLQTI